MITSIEEKKYLSPVSVTIPCPIQNKVQSIAFAIFFAGGFALIGGIYTSNTSLTATACVLISAGCLIYAFSLSKFLSTEQCVYIKPYTSTLFASLRRRLPQNMSPKAHANLQKVATLTDQQRARTLLQFSQMEYTPSSQTQLGFSIQKGAALIRELKGKGVYKKAFAAIDLAKFTLLAHIIVKIPTPTSELLVQKEINIHKMAVGPEFVKIYHHCHLPAISPQIPKMGILMEYCETDLERFMIDIMPKLSPRAKVKCIMEILENLFSGLSKLEEKKIHHRDIKPANIFLNISKKKVSAKIGDFGGATLVEDEKKYPDCFYTILYVSPEYYNAHLLIRAAKVALRNPADIDKQDESILKPHVDDLGNGKSILQLNILIRKCVNIAASTKGDIWSAGVVMFWLIAGKKFSQIHIYKDLEKYLMDLTQEKIDERFSQIILKNRKLKVLFRLCRFLLKLDARERPSAKKCLNLFLILKSEISYFQRSNTI